jgi:membrane protease subunit (stomatin/prohibitin family)
MGLMLEVLEWFDATGEEMVHRIPESGSGDLKWGAQLTVRENQWAIFTKYGKAYDVFETGQYTLTSKNLFLITKVLSAPWGFTSPFRCEVYFVNRKTFTNLRWGTREPVVFRDSELGMVRLRAMGTYASRIVEPKHFLNTVVGSHGFMNSAQVNDWLREVIVARMTDYLGDTLKTIFDLPHQYDDLAAGIKARVQADFQKYGLELVDYYVTAITPPDDVQRVIDERSAMGAAGNLADYARFKTAKALGDAAQNPSGGATFGAGFGLGAVVPGLLGGPAGPGPAGGGSPAPAGPGAAAGWAFCPACGAKREAGARFCTNCGGALQ